MKQRIEYLDSLRGFAIILVVMGHLIQQNYSAPFQDSIFNIIFSFHMPLFFFISGCAVGVRPIRSVNLRDTAKSICNKFLSLILPCVAWTALVPLFFRTPHVPSSFFGFWFLTALFTLFVLWDIIIYLLSRFNKYRTVLIGCLSIAFTALFIADIKRFTIFYFGMFLLGFFAQNRGGVFCKYKFYYSIMAVLFLLTVVYFSFGEAASGNAERIWLEIPISILASCVLHFVFSQYDAQNRWMKMLGGIGRHTLGIYVCHFMILQLPFLKTLETFPEITQFFVLALASTIICGVCISIEEITRPITWLYKLLYGKLRLPQYFD